MCQESGSQDKEGSFMDKSGEMLQKVIERERFLLHNQGLVHMCVVWEQGKRWVGGWVPSAIGYAQGISARISGFFLGSFIKEFVSIVG